MDLLNLESIKNIFKDFTRNPSRGYPSVYNSITKNKESKSSRSPNFAHYKSMWESHKEIFAPGFEPYTPAMDGWTHVMHCGFDKNPPRNHRIYINPSVDNRYEFVHTLIKESMKEGVDFYFKYASNDSRVDSLLIYATDEQLPHYANVLSKLQTDYPQFVEGCGKTPESATSVGWFAYGPEEESSKNGSLTKRVSTIVRDNITDVLCSNRHLYNQSQIDQTAIADLLKFCIEAKGETIKDSAEKDLFLHSKHPSFEKLFKDCSANLAKFILEGNITQEMIKGDLPVTTLIAEDGQSISITPSAISATLAKLQPRFSSYEEREQIFQNLFEKCEHDINEQNLNPEVPDVLKNVVQGANQSSTEESFESVETQTDQQSQTLPEMPQPIIDQPESNLNAAEDNLIVQDVNGDMTNYLKTTPPSVNGQNMGDGQNMGMEQ